ncbi:uncharacterized protein ATC70_006335 [Mucor velutinosus]|uniref:Uncharacterized protein n=1 Tax=Mucor velutinosus TaxID=708070 RepID=A0AAN7D4V7_9FUNG|nr:hypothetical protein ATC70_006335 [Mucor velutinosus]
MEIVFQSTALAAITRIAKAVSDSMSNLALTTENVGTDKSAPNSLINLPSHTTILTTKWIYSRDPNALLFDFGELNLKKEQIVPFIRASIPANITACIRPISSLLVEITILGQDEANPLHKQAYSILKNKGLHLKDKNIWLKPTQTLTMYPNLVFWQLRLSGYPKSMTGDIYKQKIADTIKCSFDKRDRGHFGKSVLVVDAENVLFSNSKTDRNIQHCFVTILVKEYTIHPPPSINSTRKLIYIPFLKTYLPIEIFLVK